MMSAKDVANFFIATTKAPQKMSNMKVNKLLYYAQAWSLVRLGRPLFNEPIEAWKHGPVIPTIYHRYEQCKENPVPIPSDTSFLNTISAEEAQLLMDVAREYDGLSAWQLRNQSHGSNEPWMKVYDPDKFHTVITKEDMEECFKRMAPLPEIGFSESFSAIPITDELTSPVEDDDSK